MGASGIAPSAPRKAASRRFIHAPARPKSPATSNRLDPRPRASAQQGRRGRFPRAKVLSLRTRYSAAYTGVYSLFVCDKQTIGYYPSDETRDLRAIRLHRTRELRQTTEPSTIGASSL